MKSHFIVLMALFAFVSVPFEAISQEQNPEVLYAGMHARDITPPIGVPLAGYGGGNRRLIPWDILGKYPYASFLKPSEGILDPIRAKVLILKRGNQKLVFVSLDTVATTYHIKRDLMKKLSPLGFKSEEVFLSSTHTHSGPGTFSKNIVWQLLAADRFKRKIYKQYLHNIYTAIANAYGSMKQATLFSSEFEAKDLTKNRRRKDDRGYVDPTTNVMWVQAHSGEFLGAMTNLAIHPTSLGTDNLHFSADITGRMEKFLEQRLDVLNPSGSERPVVLFINGAEGDVSPQNGSADHMDIEGEKFADQAMETLVTSRTLEANWSVVRKKVKLPPAGLNTKACVKQKWLKKLFPLRFWLGWILPRRTYLSAIRFDDMAFVTWPGEPTTSLGFMSKKVMDEFGVKQKWVMGLTNDYMGYFTDRKEFKQESYEACSSLHGKKGGEKIVGYQRELLKKLFN